jgi:U1 small nuclear ribonucleoprotein 70kDa
MTDKLPPNLLALFAPRPPLRWVPPSDAPPEKRKTAAIAGIADYLPALTEYEREYEYHPTESWLEARDRKKREKKEEVEKLLTEGPKKCMLLPVCHSAHRSSLLTIFNQTTRRPIPTSEATPSRL